MKNQIKLTRDSILSVPSTVGIYIFKKKNVIYYIGKSVNLKARLLSHLENAKIDLKEKKIIDSSDTIEYRLTDSEFKALLLEAKLIQEFKPKYNLILKDNKSSLYIKITIKDPYPKIFTVRKEDDHKSKYFGPFPSVGVTENILRTIRKTIPYCSQKKISSRPCFYIKINLCRLCPNLVEKINDIALKSKLKKQYKKNIRQIIKILNGQFEIVLGSLKKQLRQLTQNNNFEEAITIRDKIITLETFLSRQLKFNSEPADNQSGRRILSLKKSLRQYFPNLNQIKRIECFDISNLSMKEATASMVVFFEGLPVLDQYRKFKIKNLKLKSDFDMMAETVSRRFRNKWPYPDLMIIDGGRPQLQIILKLLSSLRLDIPLIGIAKNPDRIVIGNNNFDTVKYKYNDPGFNLIRQIRDESHRFARKYHMFLRSKKILV